MPDSGYVSIFKEMPFLKSKHQTAHYIVFFPPRPFNQTRTLLHLCSWQAQGATGNMAEPRRESTSSLQRKKPPWLRLDIPTAQMSLDEPPTFVQVTLGLSLRITFFLLSLTLSKRLKLH